MVWCKQRESWPHLLFSCSAVAAAVIAVIELAMLHGKTVGQYAALIRWIHLPVWMLTLSFVAFVRLYLRAGRRWLAWSIYGLRTLVLILNFVLTPNINFRQVTSIRHLSWWGGEIVSLPVGVPNPWGILSLLSLLLLLIFSVDATITVWRRGDRQRAFVVGGSMIFGAIVAWHVPLVIWGIINVPFFLSFAYLGIVVAMGYELSNDMFQAAQLARKLKESEERLTLAADSANFAVWEWNLNKDEVWVTPARRDLLGFPASGAIRFENFISRVHVDDRDRIRQAIKDAIEKRKVYDSEFRVVLADGSVRWMTARGTVQVNSYGKPTRMLGISIDITARKTVELQAQEQREELSHFNRVAMMGEMAASFAHELNQPLTGILSNASAGARFIDRGAASLAELRELLADIAADGRRAGDVIRSIRGMVKKGETVRKRMDVNELVMDVVRLVTPDASLRSCEVKTSLQPDLPTIEGDPIQFEQVLLNLVVNAFEAMRDTPADSRKVVIVTASDGNGAIQTSVRDFGIGISEEACGRLFDQFFTTKAEGLGMGLAIARTIVESNAGKIAAENVEGGGARFYFTFPANAAASK